MQKACAFDVPLDNKSVSPAKHMGKRLQSVEKQTKTTTLEAIKQKQDKAQELRQREQSKKIGQITQERISRVKEIRTKMETQHKTTVQCKIENKMEKALKNKDQALISVIEKAQKEVQKLGKADLFRKQKALSAQEKHQQALDKLEQAEKRRENLTQKKIQTAKLLRAPRSPSKELAPKQE